MSSSLLTLASTFTSLPSINTQSLNTRTHKTQGLRVSCNTTPDNQNDKKLIILPEPQNLVLPNVDRRNLLVGIGGMYTAANLTSMGAALAAPITSPDITSVCKDANSGFKQTGAIRTPKCCPPSLGKPIKEWTFPTREVTKMRWPAHQGTKEQVAKYRAAIKAMRDLPEDHPHSFSNQAKIHCAYCNGGYTQVANGFPDIDIQIHNSWLFFPFHRWYMYFYERILGKLINDPTFALPFWKFDEPAGMQIPDILAAQLVDGETNPLFDQFRNSSHLPPTIVDLDYGGSEKGIPVAQQIACNLSTVYRELVRNGGDTLSFFGGEYVAGDAPPDNKGPTSSVGSVEAGTHTAVHRWVGDPTQPNGEDMGNFYSAGYDPVFYLLHTNVDRMWKLWKDLALPGHVEPTSDDWLNASYVFYDENQELVRVYNSQCVNIEKLSYGYIENSKEVFPWRNSRPAKRSTSLQVAQTGEVQTVDKVEFPVKLDKILKVKVKRPAVNRTAAEKASANEVLLVSGIKFDSNKFVKFDVFVNDKLKDGVVTTPCDPEYAGGFAQVPHSDKKPMAMKSAARFGLTELLEDTSTEGEEYATVTLVPRTGCEELTVGEITIQLVPLS